MTVVDALKRKQFSEETSALSGRNSAAPIPAIRMSPGMFQTIYLNSAGSVFVMGSDNQGQLGNGKSGLDEFSSIPVHVKLPEPMSQVGSGMGTCWAISADGRHAYAWGSNKRGQLGVGRHDLKESATPIEMKFQLPRDVTIVQLADGLKAGLALLSNGKIMAWGDNQFGQAGRDPHTQGKYFYKPQVVPRISDVKQLASGDNYTLALKHDGTVWTFGQNFHGELGPNGPDPAIRHAHSFKPVQVTGLPPINSIVAGGRNGVALDENGHLWEWGRNEFGELGNGTLDPADGAHSTPTMVQGLPPIVSFDSQGPTVVAADAEGNVYCWGFNKYGAVGDGKTDHTGIPVKVLSIPTSPYAGGPSVQVAAAHRSIYAFNVVTGQTYAWGQNNYGQIGVPANQGANPNPVDITSVIAPTLDAACFREGTHILTAAGETPVERLAVGDLAITASGQARPIRWIGHRALDCSKRARPMDAWPVRIRAGAFGIGSCGDAVPVRDLFLSPGHPVVVGGGGDEILVPIMCLINGTSIARVPVERITYWHVELDEHDVLLAEGLPAESFHDLGNRPWFEDSVDHPLVDPDLIVQGGSGRCRPVEIEGAIVEAERRRLDVLFETSLVAPCAWPTMEEGSFGLLAPAGEGAIYRTGLSNGT